MAKMCATCWHWGGSFEAEKAACRFITPPAVQRIYDLLMAEPATRTNFKSAGDVWPITASEHYCDVYRSNDE